MLTDVAPSKDSSKLARAAEEDIKLLVRTSLTIGRGTVEELKKLSLNSESVLQSVVAVKDSFDSKLNTLNQSVTDLKEQMVRLNELLAAQTKNQKVEWAISNAGINSFKFYPKDNDYSGVESTGFVKTVLLSFRKGTGRYDNESQFDSTKLSLWKGQG